MSRMFAVILPVALLVPAFAFADEVAPGEPPPPQPEAAPAPEVATPVVTSAPAPAPTEEAAPPWYGQVVVGGLVDAYFSQRLRDDDGLATDASNLRVFDGQNGSFTLNYAEINFSMAPSPVGFRIDLGAGPTADAVAGVSGGGSVNFFQQAYVSFLVPGVDKLVVDFGRFVTTAGAEVIEAKDNWLYSRSLLFGFAIPFTHTGIRATYPVTPELTLQASLVNGWDVVTDPNTAKTFGLSLTYAKGDTTGLLTWYGGKEQYGLDFRNLIDLVVTQKIDPSLTLNLNVDFGVEGDNKWFGVAAMGRYEVSKKLRLALRAEYMNDPQNFRFAVPGLTELNVTEITANAAMPMGDHVELRLEGRIDIASEDIYGAPGKSTQPTLQLAALAWF
jgi:hypothetical protein